MAEEIGNYNTQYQRILVRTIDGTTIDGKVNVSKNERVSDLFRKSSEPFLVMVDVTLDDRSGRTMFVNKRHVVWVEPEE